MRPRTPSIGSKSSQPAKGPRTCGTSWSAPLQDSLNPQPDSSLKFGNVWHVIPVPPCHNLDKDSANKEGQMTSLQELLSEITPSMKPGTLELLKNKLTEVSVEEAAGVVCTAALQKSNFVRHVCSLLCKDEPSYAKLVLLELQQQFERRHCHDEVSHQYTLNSIDFLARLCAVQLANEQFLLLMGDALVSDFLSDGHKKDQPLNEIQLAEPCDRLVRLLVAVEALFPGGQLTSGLEKHIQAVLGTLALYQLREKVSRAKARSSLERPATLAAVTLAAAVAVAVNSDPDPAFPTSLKAFPFFPFDALDPPQDCISKISGLLSSKGWDEEEGWKDGDPSSSAVSAPPALYWAKGIDSPILDGSSPPRSTSVLDEDDLSEYADLKERAEKSLQVINALKAENQYLREVAEAKRKEERRWQAEKARLQKEINFQRGSLHVLRDANASLTQEVAELKLMGNHLLREVKQKIINGYGPAGHAAPAPAELAAPS